MIIKDHDNHQRIELNLQEAQDEGFQIKTVEELEKIKAKQCKPNGLHCRKPATYGHVAVWNTKEFSTYWSS